MIRWFGVLPFARLCEDCPQVDIPVGETCGWCEERININDNGMYYANPDSPPHHHECFIRMIVGSVSHQHGTCSCHQPSEQHQEPALSRRDEAKLAYLTFLSRTAQKAEHQPS